MREKKWLVIIGLIILNILFRLPHTPHEVGNDSFAIHWYGKSIVEDGRPSWLLHPASFFGLYPYSYASLVPYLLAVTSVMTGVGIESVIYFLCLLFAIVGGFSIYLLAKEVTGSELASFLSAFIFSLSPIFIRFTYWTISTRGLFVALLPLLFYFFLKWHNSRRNKWFILGSLILFMELTIHQMYFITVPFFIFSFLAALSYHQEKIRKRVSSYSQLIVASMIVVFLVFSSLQFTNIDFFKGNRYKYRTGLFLTAGSVQDWKTGQENKGIVLANMLIDYGSRIGIPLIFLPMGVFYWIKKMLERKESFAETNLLVFLVLGGIVFTLGLYTTLIYLPVFSIGASLGITKILQKTKNNKISKTILVVLIAISLVFTGFMIQHWKLRKIGDISSSLVLSEEYAGMSFIKNRLSGTIISSNRGRQLTALSNRKIFPYPVSNRYSPEILSAGIIDKTRVEAEFSPGLLSKPDYFWHSGQTINSRKEFYRLIKKDVKGNQDKIEKHDLKYLVEYAGSVLHNPFYENIHKSRSKIYNNEKQEIYSIKS